MPGKILYRGLLWTLLACVACAGIFATAQEERPHFTPGERKAPRKKDAGPRALAVLQMSANGKVSLIPVAILVNGKFWDASAYKAAPVPMALESGTVYEAERTGSSVGLFTVASALHSNSANAPVPWIGTGSWLASGKEAPNKPMKAEPTPVGVGSSDDPPRLTKPGLSSNGKPSSDKPASDKSSGEKSGASGAPPSTSTSSSSSSSGDEPPRLTKPATSSGSGDSGSTQTSSGQTNSGQTNSGKSTTQSQPASPTSTPDSKTSDSGASDSKTSRSKPSDSKPSDSKSTEAADKPAEPKPPESDSGAREGNRPRLRRGKPTTSFADEDIPGYSKPGVTPSASAKNAPAQEVIDLVPAISDAGSNDLHAFNFVWLKDEEGERRKQIEGIVKEELTAYLNAKAKAAVTPAPSNIKTGAKSAHPVAKKGPEPILENVRMVAYDLWGNNTPVIIFSADAHLPPPPAGTAHSEVDQMQYSITLVMRPDIYDTLHKLYVGVTDKYHLDITPRLQLVDAVDADGDGRGELLFKEVSDSGTGWILYRANADKLWKMFDSLSPE